MAREGDGDPMAFVVLDGHEEKPYEIGVPLYGGEIVPVFSPDSQRFAFLVIFDAGNNETYDLSGTVVVDGQDEKPYPWVEKDSLVFSPDSQRVAYVAHEGPPYGGEPVFVVLDGREGRCYDAIVVPPRSPGIIFDSPNQLHYMARKGSAFYLIEERLT